MRSAFAGSHPALNFLFFASVVAFGMVFFHPVFLGISFAAAFAYGVRLRGRRMLKTVFCLLLPTLLFVVLLGAAFNHYGVTTLFVLPNGNRVTLESIVHSLVTGGMVLTVFLWFVCYNAVVTTDKFLHVFGRAFPTGALLVSMTLRFLPIMRRRMQRIFEAQRGIGRGEGGRLRNGLHALSILVTWSLEGAVDTADSMKSRGYGIRGRTNYTRFFWTRRDAALSVLVLLGDALVIAGIVCGQTRAIYDPYICLPARTAFSYALYIGYALLCFMPLLLDLTEDYKWNRSR
ncbi:MAG: energy-coupling factor transporter transmembrane protein EcfT [Clostridia bacterium]|nr:energy-coupling factor transporter transmembrane protein EcfT [Clostridia bacterium]